MFNFKKVVAFFCVAAMTVASMVIPASAGNAYSYGIDSGASAFEGNNLKGYKTYVKLTADGLFRSEEDYDTFGSALFTYYITKGVFKTSCTTSKLADGAFDLNGADVSAMASVTPIEGNDKYDLLSVTIWGTGPLTTMTGELIEVGLNYTAKSNFPTAEIIPNPSESYIKLCDENAKFTTEVTAFNDTDYTYSLAGGANTVTKTPNKPSVEPTTPEYVYNGKDTKWGAATFVGDYSTADDKAIAVKAEVKPGQKVVDGALVDNTYTGLVWKAVKADGTAVGYEQNGLNITGNATYVFGLAIDGVSEAEVQTNGFGIAVK